MFRHFSFNERQVEFHIEVAYQLAKQHILRSLSVTFYLWGGTPEVDNSKQDAYGTMNELSHRSTKVAATKCCAMC